jgi:DNA-binding NtrC family response regulator
MRTVILSISESTSMNYLIKTVLSPKFESISASNVFDAVSILKLKRNIYMTIVDVDHHTSESFDFINHISTSSLYKIPVIVLYSLQLELLEKHIEGNYYRAFLKPFSPIHLLESIDAFIVNKAVA